MTHNRDQPASHTQPRNPTLRRIILLSAAMLLSLSAWAWPHRKAATPPVGQVNLFLGTAPTPHGHFSKYGNGGDVFPGAATPFGMVQFSPDTHTAMPGGYFYPDRRITGFSLDHYSGRGCLYEEDIGFMPVSGGAPFAKFPSQIEARFSHHDERATPGYYRVQLRGGVRVQLTATPRSGMARFTFPPARAESVIINAGHSARGTLAAAVRFVTPREVAGWAQIWIGCGQASYRVYFDAVVDHFPAASGVWRDNSLQPGGHAARGRSAGAYLSFRGGARRTVLMKVGLSYVSAADARDNRRQENPGWHFAAVRRRSAGLWNRALGRIMIQGGTLAARRIFYTALYHAMLEPSLFSDANRRYLGFDGRVHRLPQGRRQYDNISGWDFYRSQAPFIGFLFPAVASDIAQSLVNDARQDPGGGIPRWEQINHNSNGMVGDGNVPLIANLYAFGGRNFQRHAALRAMLRNALRPGATSDGHLVRPHLRSYLRRGWVGVNQMRAAAAATLEYANSDFAAAQFAHALGDRRAMTRLLRHAGNWRSLFNPKTLYLQPRDADGHWPADRLSSDYGWAEGSTTQYTWMVPYDLPGLIACLGGAQAAARRLDVLFHRLNAGPRSRHYFNGNEPGETTPWIYDFLGRPWKTQRLIRRIQTTLWTDTPQGLPGNDDGGALSSWYVFSAIGLYPEIPGVGGFVLGSPQFHKIVLHLARYHALIIESHATGPAGPYVRSLRINGRTSQSLWLPAAAVRATQRLLLQFRLSNARQRNAVWGAAPQDAPPSFFPSHGRACRPMNKENEP